MNNISWTQYETYLRCPRAYTWLYHTAYKKEYYEPTKDTRYLERGNAIQGAVDLWAQEDGYLFDDNTLITFIKEKGREVSNRCYQKATETGKPSISYLDFIIDVESILLKSLPLLKSLIDNIYPKAPKGIIEAQKEFTTPYKDITISAVLDLLVKMPSGQYLIIEGKSTQLNIKEDLSQQLVWQSHILRDHLSLSNMGYLFFYTRNTHQVYDCSFDFNWVKKRDSYLDSMIEGNSLANPSSKNCRHCSHRFRCPDSKKATNSFTTMGSKKIMSRVISLE